MLFVSTDLSLMSIRDALLAETLKACPRLRVLKIRSEDCAVELPQTLVELSLRTAFFGTCKLVDNFKKATELCKEGLASLTLSR